MNWMSVERRYKSNMIAQFVKGLETTWAQPELSSIVGVALQKTDSLKLIGITSPEIEVDSFSGL